VGALPLAVWSQTPPRIFFSDLESGPNTGGANNQGVYVTLFGRNFGANRGSSRVTAGGGEASAYPLWTDAKITFQLGPAARTGDITVATANGTSNPAPFTVRDGEIFFVSPSGNDNQDGSFSRPWRTIVKAKNTMQAGATTYLMDGVSQTTEEAYSAAVSIERGGVAGRPMALVAYPGARVTIGSETLEMGLRIPNISEAAAADFWVISQLSFRGGVSAVSLEGPNPSNWRVVGNDISCPAGDGQTGCFVAALASNVRLLGNEVHHTGRRGASKQYHAVYFTTDSNHIEAGWNSIHDNNTCRAIQFHSSPLCVPDCGPRDTTGLNQYDLKVHDNLIRGDACDGINFATVDPSKGTVEACNNVIVRAGAGPHPPDGSANYACIYVAGGTNTGPDGAGNVEVYNNTCYDFGAVDPSFVDAGGFMRGDGSPRLILNLRNNIAYALNRQAYVRGPDNLIRGANNLWFGNGPGPAWLQNNVNADPLFVSPAQFDFRLRAGSPAIDAGVATGLTTDFDGAPRPQGRATDLGAFEYGSGAAPPPQRPLIAAGGIVDGFSFLAGAVAPGEIVTILGTGLGPPAGVATQFDPATNRLPTSVSGTSVTWNAVPAPLYFVRADQINLQVPYELAGASRATVAVTYNGQSSAPESLAVQPERPQLFPRGFHADFRLISSDAPASPGEVVIFFATGQGATNPASASGAAPGQVPPVTAALASVRIGDRPAQLLFSGQTPGTAGVMQLNVQVPTGTPPGNAAVVLRVGPADSQPGVAIPVR
jgi:uncharacterized protein (TIGR03437 family)